MEQQRELLGSVTAPSGTILLIDMGMLNYWCHDREPMLEEGLIGDPEVEEMINTAIDVRIEGPDAIKAGEMLEFQWHPQYLFDIPHVHIQDVSKRVATIIQEHKLDAHLVQIPSRISHRARVDLAVEYGKGVGEVQYHGMFAIAIGGLPRDEEIPIYGIRMADPEYHDRWQWVYLDVAPGLTPLQRQEIGVVLVDRGQLMFADVDALRKWHHDESLDGQADFLFWGRDAHLTAQALQAPRVGEDYGWRDQPVETIIELGLAVEQDREERGLLFATDFRPHSHHHFVMEQVRATATESGIIEVGGAKMCGLITTWGDGAFPVYREVDDGGALVRVSIELGNEQTLHNMKQLVTGGE